MNPFDDPANIHRKVSTRATMHNSNGKIPNNRIAAVDEVAAQMLEGTKSKKCWS